MAPEGTQGGPGSARARTPGAPGRAGAPGGAGGSGDPWPLGPARASGAPGRAAASGDPLPLGLARLCTPVPSPAERACRLCHGHLPTGAAGELCSGCCTVTRQVPAPCEVVAPISLYAVGGGFHRLLRAYKDDPRPAVRDACGEQLAGLLGTFLSNHSACIAAAAGRGGSWDAVATVPSSAGRPGPHPLRRVVERAVAGRWELTDVLRPGPARPGHRQARRQGYLATGGAQGARGARLLLVDDTWTSGARAESAASALHEAGGRVVAIVVLGRVADPHFSAEASADWARWRTQPFDVRRCCLGAAGVGCCVPPERAA